MANRVDTASKLIRAPAAALYRAFAAPGAMELWLPPPGMTGRMLTFDFREGGGYRLRLTYDEAGAARGKTTENADEVECRFLELIPHERIVQAGTFESDDPEFAGEMRVRWSFEPVAEGTRVTVRCENVPSGIRPEDHEAGLQSSLENLAAFVVRPS